jgi:hypothetical protein
MLLSLFVYFLLWGFVGWILELSGILDFLPEWLHFIVVAPALLITTAIGWIYSKLG